MVASVITIARAKVALERQPLPLSSLSPGRAVANGWRHSTSIHKAVSRLGSIYGGRGSVRVILRRFNLVLCRRPTVVPSCHEEAATTRLLPGKTALPSDDGHDTAVVASAAGAVRMPLPQVR